MHQSGDSVQSAQEGIWKLRNETETEEHLRWSAVRRSDHWAGGRIPGKGMSPHCERFYPFIAASLNFDIYCILCFVVGFVFSLEFAFVLFISLSGGSLRQTNIK